MFKNIKTLLGLLSVFIVGWFLGYVNFPEVEWESTFWIGFIAAFCIIALGYFVFSSYFRKSKELTIKFNVYLLVTAFLGICSSVSLSYKNRFYVDQLKENSKEIVELSRQFDSVQQRQQMPLLVSLLEKVEKELDNEVERTLSVGTIDQISNFSKSLEVYKFHAENHLSFGEYSIERSHLFLNLCKLNIESSTFERIKREVQFTNLKLSNVELSNLDLSGIDFRNSSLIGVDFSNSNLREANFGNCTLARSKFKNAQLKGSNLISADLSWTNGDFADFSYTRLKAANFRGASLIGTDFRHSKFKNTSIKVADMTKSNLRGVELRTVEMQGANFDSATLINLSVIGGSMLNSNFSNALVDSTFLHRLSSTSCIGAKDELVQYISSPDTSGIRTRRLKMK
ncbi:MAG: pentapeptide repeat-containing protein [Bacteroidia bacterium]